MFDNEINGDRRVDISFRKAGRVAALAVVAAVVGGGLAIAPAAASEVKTENAPVNGNGYEAFAQKLIASDDAIAGVGQDGKGNIIVSAKKGTLAASTEAELKTYDNVVVKDRGPIKALKSTDVVGGAGYAIDRRFVCSFGFSGWSQTGDPAIISAGHCGTAGATVERTVPSGDDAPYYPDESPGAKILDSVGTFAFSQWGGPNGSEGADGDLTSTDISAITVTNKNLTLLPKITDWKTWASGDLSASGTAVTAVGTVKVGDQITRSGRTSGSHSGTVLDPNDFAEDGEPITVVEDKTWIQVCEEVDPEPKNCHFVYGFFTNAVSIPGDSGGPFVRGTTAVGVLSGGDDEISFATDLQNGLKQTPGYTIMLDLAEPVVTSGASVVPGGKITGTGPAGLNLVYTVGGVSKTVTIGADGTWSIDAPAAEGTYAYTFQVNDAPTSFNKSDVVNHSVTVAEKAVAAPVITAPAKGSTVVGPNVTVSGTGEPGATIELSASAGAPAPGAAAARTAALAGDLSGTATVAANGTWSVKTTAPYGAVGVTATQTAGKSVSTASTTFTVAVAGPVFTSPAPGAKLTESPKAISGTGIPGAEVTVVLDGETLGTATVGQDGTWTLPVKDTLAAGPHQLSAVQSVGGSESAAAKATFQIQVVTTPTPTPTEPGGGGLATTGADGGALLGLGAAGGALVLLAGAMLTFARVRAKRAAE